MRNVTYATIAIGTGTKKKTTNQLFPDDCEVDVEALAGVGVFTGVGESSGVGVSVGEGTGVGEGVGTGRGVRSGDTPTTEPTSVE